MRVLRWVWGLLGGALLAGVAWLLGPLLPALEDPLRRAALAALALLAGLGATGLAEWRRRRRAAALAAGLGAEPARETAALESRFATALAALRTQGALQEQPWYAIIGPPGAGKTTALLNAGLEFPLAGTLGPGAVPGVGGTRLCEWWFTADAVLIDTAGRYTTQDSDAAVDRAGWNAFLDLLARTRPRQPLNGVIVAIALADVLDAAASKAHAAAIRQRIAELDAKFGLRLPMYAMFTKTDLIAGFSEFFDDLDRDARAQVWGMTFSPSDTVASFAAGFRTLLERVEARLLGRLQAESNAQRRTLIAGFTAQVASLQAPLAAFLTEAFGGSPAPRLRGVYLTSATQDGTPIDRLTGMLAQAFGLAPQRAARLRPQAGRSYFLSRLLRDVVFGEAMLVSNPARARQRRALRAAAFVGLALLTAAAGGALLYARAGGMQAVAASRAALSGYEQSAGGRALDPVADADLPALLPLLDQAHAVALETQPDPLGWLGLSQSAKLAAGAHGLYRHALGYALLPRLVWRLEAQLRGALGQPDVLFEATRVYLMLGGAGPLDSALVRDWMGLDWQLAYPGEAAAPLRASLARHLDALLAEPLPAVALDGDLVAQARAAFGKVTLAQRVYARIRASAAAQRVPPWRPATALGPAGAGLFLRASGRSLGEGIAGFTTVEGFHEVLLPSLEPAARQAAADGWVLGERAAPPPDAAALAALKREVVELYEADYVQAWDQLLADLNPAAPRSLVQAAQGLYILSHAESPLRALLAAIARELSLSAAPAGPGATGAEVTDTQLQLRALRGAKLEDAPRLPGQEIDDRYADLRNSVSSGALDQALRTLGDVQQQLAKLAASATRASPAPNAADDPAAALRSEARTLPQPLARWFTVLADSGAALRSGDPRPQIVAVYTAAGGPGALCAASVTGHFPFVPDAAAQTSLDDFTTLFAPGGALDGFFNTLLKPYVDSAGKVWQPRAADGVPAPIAPAELAQFQRAALIRDLFFVNGRSAEMRFDIAPVSIAHATEVTLDLDGTVVSYGGGAAGTLRATQVRWPGPGLLHGAKLAFTPAGPEWQESGPWALFRLFARGKLQQTGDHFSLTFQMGERQAAFDIRTGAVPHPLVPGLLSNFRCPVVQ